MAVRLTNEVCYNRDHISYIKSTKGQYSVSHTTVHLSQPPPPPNTTTTPSWCTEVTTFLTILPNTFLSAGLFLHFGSWKPRKSWFLIIFFYMTMIDYLRVFFTRDPLLHFNPIILFGISLTLSQQVKTYKFRIGFLRLFLTRDPLFHFNPIILFCISLSVSNKLIPKIAS